jgi:F-type H+-transporting ATPase subunit a
MLAEINPLQEVVAKELFRFELFGLEVIVTNHMFMVTLAAVLLLILLPIAVRGSRGGGFVRRGFGNLIETVCVFIRQEVAKPFMGDATDRYIGFIWTIFFFILSLNLLGMVPIGRIITLLTGRVTHLEGAATANIWVVGALATISFFAIHISGICQQGVKDYFKHFAPSVPWPILPFIYVLEIIGALVKPFALAIRLFANILAGHVVLATLLGFVFIFRSYAVGVASVTAAVLLSFLELFVAFLQAYIFTFLTSIFIGFAVKPQH